MAHKNTRPAAVTAAWRKVRLRLRIRRAASACCACSLCTKQHRLSSSSSSPVNVVHSVVCVYAGHHLALTPLAKPTRRLNRLTGPETGYSCCCCCGWYAHTEHAPGTRDRHLSDALSVRRAIETINEWNATLKSSTLRLYLTDTTTRWSEPAPQPTNKPLNPLPPSRSLLANANTELLKPKSRWATANQFLVLSTRSTLALTHSNRSACVGVSALAGRSVRSDLLLLSDFFDYTFDIRVQFSFSFRVEFISFECSPRFVCLGSALVWSNIARQLFI